VKVETGRCVRGGTVGKGWPGQAQQATCEEEGVARVRARPGTAMYGSCSVVQGVQGVSETVTERKARWGWRHGKGGR